MDGRLIYLMGPSGAGKDAIIDAAREPLRARGCEVARRVITRSAEAVGEEAVGVSKWEFQLRQRRGEFALSWRANGLDYGIPIEIDRCLAAGRHVIVNGSRGHLSVALKRYPALVPVLLEVEDHVLRERLLKRGRESLVEIEARLRRNEVFAAEGVIGGIAVHRLDNSGELAATVERLLVLLGFSAKSDQI